jgi:MFS family permease
MALTSSIAESVFDKKHRSLTIGLILGITLFAFENLAITTVAPHIAESLNGITLYGWMFTGFLLASLFSTVLGGEWADRYGSNRPLTIGLIVFGIGLLVSATASSMLTLILGRIIQGLGGGAIITALYTVINLAYSDALRPRIITLMSSAWVMPALVGPALAGYLAEIFSWRVLFWGVVPLLFVVAALTIPTFYRLKQERSKEVKESRFPFALGLVMGTGMLLYGFSLSSPLMMVATVLCGGVLAFWSLQFFLPRGTFILKPGLPALIATRGLSFAAFVGIEAYLSLMLSEMHGYSTALTGGVIAVGTLSWTLGTWLQDRFEKSKRKKKRRRRVIWGSLILLLGSSLQIVVLYSPDFSLWLTLTGWLLAGVGIGLAHSTISVLAFASAPEGKEGKISAALQLTEQFASAFCTGLGGALLAYAISSGLGKQFGIALAFAVASGMGVLGVIAAYRTGAASKSTVPNPKPKAVEQVAEQVIEKVVEARP